MQSGATRSRHRIRENQVKTGRDCIKGNRGLNRSSRACHRCRELLNSQDFGGRLTQVTDSLGCKKSCKAPGSRGWAIREPNGICSFENYGESHWARLEFVTQRALNSVSASGWTGTAPLNVRPFRACAGWGAGLGSAPRGSAWTEPASSKPQRMLEMICTLPSPGRNTAVMAKSSVATLWRAACGKARGLSGRAVQLGSAHRQVDPEGAKVVL